MASRPPDPKQIQVQFRDRSEEVFSRVDTLVFEADEYILRQGDGGVVIPKDEVRKLTVGENIDGLKKE